MRNVALISGGSRGIGAACVQAMARAGYAVIFLYHRHKAEAEALTAELRGEGCDVACRACDIGDFAQAQATVADLLTVYRHIDVLVNNAGIAHIGLITDMTEAQWDRLFAVNLKGAFALAQAVLPGMISRQRGAIVNIASMWGEVGASCEAAYSASKAALIGLTKALSKEVGPSGVRVNCVSPGVIATDMNAELDADALGSLREETPLQRIGTAEDVAKTVLFLSGEGAAFITGQVVGVSGGLVV